MVSVDLRDFALSAVADLKAKDVVTLDITALSDIADFMIVCTGTSKTHVKSIAQNVEYEAKQKQIEILGIEGRDVGEWVLVDLGDVIVHVMQEETRNLYALEKLWS